jgi:spore germination protein YaaH
MSVAALAAIWLGASVLPAAPAVAAQSPLLHWAYVVPQDADSLRSLQANATRFHYVSPNAYAVDVRGNLKGDVSASVVAAARRAGAKVLPMVRNEPRYAAFSPILQSPEVRAALVRQIVDDVARNGWDGIHIDFEALEPTDRDALTAFFTDLSAQLHARGKLSTIAAPARLPEVEWRWSAPYDYAALGAAGDYVVIMAYAFHTSGSTPGSISPIGSVDRAARFAVSKIPPGKLLLGIGLWGYDWRIGSPGNAAPRKYAETRALGDRYAGEFGYGSEDQSAWLRYRDAGGDRVVWYEDRRSVPPKVDLANRFGMAGVAYWRLGHEDSAVWTSVGPRTAGPMDFAVEGGWFFRQTGGSTGYGFRVVDVDSPTGPVKFYSEFRRLGGVSTLGYPVSQRYVGPGGFAYQAFQRGVLQWRLEQGIAYLANTFDQLTDAGLDGALVGIGIPRSAGDDGSGGDWNVARRTRLDWLTNDAIRQHFRRNPNPAAISAWSEDVAIQLYGLPTSRPERSGPFVVQRFQRVALQLWIEGVPGMPARGSVVGILGGDLLKQHGLIPASATQPEAPRAVALPIPGQWGDGSLRSRAIDVPVGARRVSYGRGDLITDGAPAVSGDV